MNATIVLASGSASRRAVLGAAGIPFVVDKPEVDESAIKVECQGLGLDASQTALRLAIAKATLVAGRHPGKIVIGADQMLECDGVWFDKPPDMAAAARQIAQMAGRDHRLISAVVGVRDGEVIWQTIETATMTVRPLSEAAIQAYLDVAGEKVLQSVGAYQVEGLGIHLFDAIEGSHFTIMGMPLLPLLAFLRTEGVLSW